MSRLLMALVGLAVLAACDAQAPSAPGGPRILVFTRTAGFRHASIPTGIAAIRDLGAAGGFAVDSTEDGALLSAGNLARYRALVFLNTSGEVLDKGRQRDVEAFIRGGGGFVGVHAAADTGYDWPFYGELVGAYFAGHPAIQPARLRVVDRAHPATAHLDAVWSRTDEWYNFRTNPRPGVHVLIALDESTYTGGTMGADHPIAWCRPVGAGRSFYTGGGHADESYAEPAFRAHLLGGIRYAAGLAPADCAVPISDASPDRSTS